MFATSRGASRIFERRQHERKKKAVYGKDRNPDPTGASGPGAAPFGAVGAAGPCRLRRLPGLLPQEGLLGAPARGRGLRPGPGLPGGAWQSRPREALAALHGAGRSAEPRLPAAPTAGDGDRERPRRTDGQCPRGRRRRPQLRGPSALAAVRECSAPTG